MLAEQVEVLGIREASADEIFVSSAPPIPGLVFRGFRGEADYPNMLAVINGSKESDGIERTDTLEDVKRTYAHLVNCDPYQDMIFAEIAGEVVGYGRVEWNIAEDRDWLGFHLGFVLPVWRRKGLGRVMLHYQENRLREIYAGLVEMGLCQVPTARFFTTIAYDTEVGRVALLEAEGYAAVRHEFVMVRPNLEDIPAAPMPAGLEVRPVHPEHYRLIWDAAQEAFRDHWGYVPPSEEDYQGWLVEPGFDPSLWRVAWEGDQVAGMVLGFINPRENQEYRRKRGWTEGICVRRPWRRKGLARSLLVQSLYAIKERGMAEAALSVDTQNLSGALRLYESVGFRQVKHFSFYRKGF